jgi:hypothetical protein
MKWPVVLVVLGGIILGCRLLHVPWKETIAIMMFLAIYVEFDVCTRQVEKLMDRINELEDRMRTLEAQTRDLASPHA